MESDLNKINKRRYEKVSPYLYKDTKTGIYYVSKTFKRLMIPRLFKTTSELRVGKARAIAEDLIESHKQFYLGAQSDSLSKRLGTPIWKIVDEILKTKTPLLRATTQEQHHIYLKELKTHWGSWDINRVTLSSWQTWLDEFRGNKIRKTFFDYAKYMNLILRYAYQNKYSHHLLTLKNPDSIHHKVGRVFSSDEVKALWSQMNTETRDQFVLCFECFMRLREALYLTWDRVDLVEGIAILTEDDVKTGSKTGRGRTFRLSPRALERLKRRLLTRVSPYVFPSPLDPSQHTHSNKTAWIRAKRKAGIQGRARWHDLRHTAISRALLEKKISVVLVSEYSGVSIRTLQKIYLHSTHKETAPVAKSLSVLGKKGSNEDQTKERP